MLGCQDEAEANDLCQVHGKPLPSRDEAKRVEGRTHEKWAKRVAREKAEEERRLALEEAAQDARRRQWELATPRANLDKAREDALWGVVRAARNWCHGTDSDERAEDMLWAAVQALDSKEKNLRDFEDKVRSESKTPVVILRRVQSPRQRSGG